MPVPEIIRDAGSRKKLIQAALLGAAVLIPAVSAFLLVGRRGAKTTAEAPGGVEEPEGPGFTIRDDEPWVKPVAGDEFKRRPAQASGPASRSPGLKPPAVGQARSADGSQDRIRRLFREEEARSRTPARAAGLDREPPVDRMKAFSRDGSFARASALPAAAAGDALEYGRAAAPAQASAPRPGSAVLQSNPVAGRGPVATSGPVQRAMPVSRGGLPYGPVGSSGREAVLAGAASAAAKPGAPDPSGAPVAPGGAGWGAREGSSPNSPSAGSGSGGSWGEPIRGGSGGGDGGGPGEGTVPLGAIEKAGKIWGMDLSTLYKKLKEKGVTAEQLRLLEACLAGESGCKGGDIWEACTKAAIWNSCVSVCSGTPGCVAPGGKPKGGTPCEPAPGCAEDGTIVKIERCGGAVVFRENTPCCSCDTSAYSTSNPNPTYSNTGVNCGISCPSDQYCAHFCAR